MKYALPQSRVTAEEYQAFARLAESVGVSRSELVRRSVAAAVDRPETVRR